MLDINDVTMCRQCLAEYDGFDLSDEKTFLQADFSGDGKVNIRDVTAMQRALAGY